MARSQALRLASRGGEPQLENQLGGRLAGVLLPEPYELENRVGLLAFGDAGIGIARCSASRAAKTIVTGGRRVPAACHNREIAFAHGYRQITDAVAGGSGFGPALWLAEKGSAFLGIVAELMADDAVTETTGNVGGTAPHRRRVTSTEEGTEGFVLKARAKKAKS
jgi:hypothetical protein